MITAPNTEKKRIEWIDTAKGICIILVVLNHVFLLSGLKNSCPSFIYHFFDAFRMPLYFFLSGLFFKTYGSFGNFFKKKINKLLIPFAFFYVVSCFIRLVLNSGQSDHPPFVIFLADFYYYHCSMVNGPLWFLLCLFEVNIIFYALFLICRDEKILCLLALIIGMIGLTLSFYHIRLPMTISTSFTCLPFFCMGYYTKEHTQILYKSAMDKHILPIAAICGLICFFFFGCVLYVENSFKGISYFTAHLCGGAGTMMVILLSKKIGPRPLVSYIGRYSIIVLCTHILVLDLITALLGISPLSYHFIWIFVLIIAIEFILIPIMTKYLPHVTAQKDIL